jgi:hypothetical protein
VPARQAASTPSGTATVTDSSMVQTVSARVGSTRWASSVVTGRLLKIDTPRSPWSRAQAQVPNRIRKGWSSPSRARMRATSWAVA